MYSVVEALCFKTKNADIMEPNCQFFSQLDVLTDGLMDNSVHRDPKVNSYMPECICAQCGISLPFSAAGLLTLLV